MYRKKTPLMHFSIQDREHVVEIHNSLGFVIYLLMGYVKLNKCSLDTLLDRNNLLSYGAFYEEYCFMGLVTVTQVDGFPIFKVSDKLTFIVDGLDFVNHMAVETLFEGKVDELIVFFDTKEFDYRNLFMSKVVGSDIVLGGTTERFKLIPDDNQSRSLMYFDTGHGNKEIVKVYDEYLDKDPHFWDLFFDKLYK